MPSRIASWFVIVGVVFTGCLSIRAGQTTVRPSVFTAEQAEAGLKELQTNSFGKCTDCHGNNLGGRNGGPGELPLLSSLREDDQTMVTNYGGKVPALVGPTFRARWAGRTTKDLGREFQDRFGPPLTEETRLNIISYILQANGALSGPKPLTMDTDVQIRVIVPVDFSK